MKAQLLLIFLLTACSATTTRPEDAGVVAEMDAATITEVPDGRPPSDAHRPDAAAPDAFTQDAWRRDASTQDAFVPPGERCNGLDEDFDGRIDETAICSGTQECADGTCQCVPGTYACNPFVPENCDVTDITTREHCGGCSPCTEAEDCSVATGTPQCVPTLIRDFSTASETSGITCIIRESDRHVVCREPTGWRDMRMEARTVRAWGGTVCVLSNRDRDIYCRGSNATGLVIGEFNADGWARVAELPEPFSTFFFSIEGGEGVVFASDLAFVWGGPNGTGVIRLLPGDAIGGIGDGSRRFAMTIVGGQSTLRTWGEPHPTLSTVPWTDHVIGASRRIMQTVETDFAELSAPGWVGCYNDNCCVSTLSYQLYCWGGADATAVQLVSIETGGWSGQPNVFPTPTGMRVCINRRCASLEGLHAAAPGTLTLEPEDLAFNLAQARSDWRGRCIRDDVGHIVCQGLVPGWPIP